MKYYVLYFFRIFFYLVEEVLCHLKLSFFTCQKLGNFAKPQQPFMYKEFWENSCLYQKNFSFIRVKKIYTSQDFMN